MTSAKEHYDWCIKRAEEYLDRGDAQQGFASFASDMKKHKDTYVDPILMAMGMMDIMKGPEAVRRFIRGFNF